MAFTILNFLNVSPSSANTLKMVVNASEIKLHFE